MSRRIFSKNVTATAVTSDDLEVDDGTLSIDATNNRVGVGTTSPEKTLHIHGANSTDLEIPLTERNSGNTDNLGFNLGYLGGVGSASTNRFSIESDNAGTLNERFVITRDTGRVGIGTTDPGTTLDVSAADPTVRITDTTDGAFSDGDVFGTLEFYSEDTQGPGGGGAGIISYIKATHLRAGINHSYSDSGLTFGTSNSGSVSTKMKLDNAGNLHARPAITLSTSTSDIDLTSTAYSTTFILDAVMAAGQAITLPQPTAALAGMVIDIHLMQDCATTPNTTGPAIGLANGGSGVLKGSLTLMSTGANMDVVAIPSSQKALWLDSDSEKMSGGAAGSHYQFIYAGGTTTVYVKAVAMTSHATPALDANYAFGGGSGTS